MPKWLAVVKRAKHEVYVALERSFQPDPQVQVILDRRQRERRSDRSDVDADRRGPERRQPMTAHEQAVWNEVGSRLITRRDVSAAS